MGIGALAARSIFGKPKESEWPGFRRLPHFPDFLPNFQPIPFDKVVPLAEGAAFRNEAVDLLRKPPPVMHSHRCCDDEVLFVRRRAQIGC